MQPNGCFKCCELGHYANCPKRGMQTPQRSIVQKVGQSSAPVHPGNSSTPGNKAQQNYERSKVNNMTVEQAQDASGLCLVRFLSTLYLPHYCLIREQHIHLLLISS
jgi:hypothetical protein